MDRINWVTSACFRAIGQLEHGGAGNASSPEEAHRALHAALTEVLRRAREAAYTDENGHHIAYALAALADEVAMRRGGELRAYWSSRALQLRLFGENVAGERFFVYLARVRAADVTVDVLRVYYLCLQFGFRGRYGARADDESLGKLIAGVREELLARLVIPERLVPRTPSQAAPPQRRPRPIALRVGVGALLATLALHLGLSTRLRHERTRLAEVARIEVTR